MPGGEDQNGTSAASCISSSCRTPSRKESETFASLSSSPHPRSEAAGPLPSGKTSLFCDRHCCRLLGNFRRIATHRFFNHPRRQLLLLYDRWCAPVKKNLCAPSSYVFHVLFSCPFFFLCAYSRPPPKNSPHAHFFSRFVFIISRPTASAADQRRSMCWNHFLIYLFFRVWEGAELLWKFKVKGWLNTLPVVLLFFLPKFFFLVHY